MPPVETSSIPVTATSHPAHLKLASVETGTSHPNHMKVVDKALEFPVVSDAVNEVTKLANNIREQTQLKQAIHFVEDGIKRINDNETISSMKDRVMPLTDYMVGAVDSLDSMACGGLEQLKSAVPVLAAPTPELMKKTKGAASGYLTVAVNYLCSFYISQVYLRVMDASLALSEMAISGIMPSLMQDQKKGQDQEGGGGIGTRALNMIRNGRSFLGDLKKGGMKARSESSLGFSSISRMLGFGMNLVQGGGQKKNDNSVEDRKKDRKGNKSQEENTKEWKDWSRDTNRGEGGEASLRKKNTVGEEIANINQGGHQAWQEPGEALRLLQK